MSVRFKPAILLVGIFISAILTARIVMKRIEFDYPGSNWWLKRRLEQTLNHLPDIIASPEPLVLVLGASDVEIAFMPKIFDRDLNNAGLKVKSFNLGSRNMSAVMPTFTDRLVEEFNLKHRRAKLIAVKFTQMLMTRRAVSSETQIVHRKDDLESVVVSPRQISGLFWRGRLNEALQLAADKYLFDGMSPSAASGYARLGFLQIGAVSRYSLWQDRALWVGEAWDLNQQGWSYFGYPKTADALTAGLSRVADGTWQLENFAMNIAYGDVADLNFDPDAINDFIKIVMKLKTISDHVIIYNYPDRAKDIHPPEALARLNMVYRKIEGETAVRVIDYPYGSIPFDEYIDNAHLNLKGAERTTHMMAKDIAKILNGDR